MRNPTRRAKIQYYSVSGLDKKFEMLYGALSAAREISRTRPETYVQVRIDRDLLYQLKNGMDFYELRAKRGYPKL